jgi:hypothetical protein
VKRILAIAGLTWKSAFRYRLFWILAALLVGAVVGLPLLLKDDGTAKGLTQILLTYTLSAVTALLGIATLWLSCGTLARDVEECQMQMVTVKPISRWQVWIGKWLGIMGLNGLLLAIAGSAIFFLLQWRASHLSAPEQKILHEEIFVARASVKDRPPDFGPIIEREMQKRNQARHYTEAEEAEIRKQVTGWIIALNTEVPPEFWRGWVVDLHKLPEKERNQPLQIRVKFNTASPNPDATYMTYWVIGPTNSNRAVAMQEMLPSDSYQQFQVPGGLLDDQGRLVVEFANFNNVSLIFPLDDGFELLYNENTFGVNFIRGVVVIFCWLALLATIGLASASFLSFPVAAFASLAILLVGLSSNTVSAVVQQGTITGFDAAAGGYGHTPVDLIFIPVFRGLLWVIQLVESFSPIDYLSSGRSITWGNLGEAVGEIIFLLGGIFALIGIFLFSRRELATAQGNS